MKLRLLALGLAMCAGLMAGCENPLEIDRETEIAIGRQGAADLESKHGVVADPVSTRRLNAIGRRVAAATEEPDLPWTFKILNQQEVNALALPGGFVYATKGMMEYVRDDDQLAGVIGHEAVHVAQHHGKAAIERVMAGSLLVELVTRKSSDTIRQAARIAVDLELREGYRDKEYEADRHGTRYAYRSGYAASGLRQLLAHLHEAKGDPARITWLLQSHPPLSKRVQRLDEYIPTLTRGR